MSGVSISRYETIGEAPEEPWRAATQRRFACSPEWLAMLETNGVGLDRRYALAESGSHHGAVCSYLFNEQVPMGQQPLGLLTEEESVAQVLEYLPAEEHPTVRTAVAELTDAGVGRAAVAVSSFRHQHTMVADDPQLLPALITELEDNASRWDCPSSAVLYVDAREHALRQALTEAGYVGWICGARCELPITYSSMDDYIAAHNRRRRNKIRREIENFKQAGITVSSTPIPEDTTELARLAALHEEKFGHGYNLEFQDMVLQNFRKFVGEHCFIVTGSRDGELVGFVVIFRDRGDAWHVAMTGWDDSRRKPDEFAYFNIIYYAVIEMAIRDGIKLLDYQVEAYDAKVNRGCVPWPLWCFMKVTESHRAQLERVTDAHLRGMRELFGNRFSVSPEFL